MGRPSNKERAEKAAAAEQVKAAPIEKDPVVAPVAAEVVMIQPLDGRPRTFEANGERWQISGGVSECSAERLAMMLNQPVFKGVRIFSEDERKAYLAKKVADEKSRKDAEEKAIKDRAEFAKKAKAALDEAGKKDELKRKADHIVSLKLDVAALKELIKDNEATIKAKEKEIADLEK